MQSQLGSQETEQDQGMFKDKLVLKSLSLSIVVNKDQKTGKTKKRI
jgi:uncharacterized protein YwbE